MLLLLSLACSPGAGWAPGVSGDPGEENGVGAAMVLPVSDVRVAVHPTVATILQVSWTQTEATEGGWVEFRSDGEDWSSAPELPRDVGENSATLLGEPADTDVEVRFVDRIDGQAHPGLRTWSGRTGSLPDDLLEPDLVVYDPDLASPERFVLGSLDTNTNWYGGPFYVWILNRAGRVVWYRAVAGRRACVLPRVARDGSHILYEESPTYVLDDDGDAILHRTTLDGSVDVELAMPGFAYAYDEADDGDILSDDHSDSSYRMVWRTPDGAVRPVWDCPTGTVYACYTNTVNLSPAQDSALWSIPTRSTVIEIDLATGLARREFGAASPADWQPDSPETRFSFQHFPTWTPDGTLLLSTHVPGQSNQQRAREYAVDDAKRTLHQVWEYGEGRDDYAYYAGEAWRLPEGNTFLNYGTGGVAREVTADGTVAWEVQWPASLLLGHMTPVDDLDALNRGPGR